MRDKKSITIRSGNKFFQFTPTITMGNIATVISVIVVGAIAWTQLRMQVADLTKENESRKVEIATMTAKEDVDRTDLYKKISSDHAETENDIKNSQQITHDDIKELTQTLGNRFDRVEDKLDKKVDKK